jgi:hypothetical protein
MRNEAGHAQENRSLHHDSEIHDDNLSMRSLRSYALDAWTGIHIPAELNDCMNMGRLVSICFLAQ